MIRSEILKVIYSRRSLFFIFLIFIIPFIDLISNWKNTFLDYYLNPEYYGDLLPNSQILHPAKAAFLAGSSTAHISQMLLIWILPFYILIIYSDSNIAEKNIGYSNIMFTKISRIKIMKTKYLLSFIIPFILMFVSLNINFIFSIILFKNGESFMGMEKYLSSEDTLLRMSLDNPYITYYVYIIVFCSITGLLGLICTANSFIFPNYKITYAISFFSWIILIMVKDSITFLFQPFIEYGFMDMIFPTISLLFITLIFTMWAWIYKVKYDEI